MRQPGTMERIFGGTGRASSMGGMMGGMGGEERDFLAAYAECAKNPCEARH